MGSRAVGPVVSRPLPSERWGSGRFCWSDRGSGPRQRGLAGLPGGAAPGPGSAGRAAEHGDAHGDGTQTPASEGRPMRPAGRLPGVLLWPPGRAPPARAVLDLPALSGLPQTPRPDSVQRRAGPHAWWQWWLSTLGTLMQHTASPLPQGTGARGHKARGQLVWILVTGLVFDLMLSCQEQPQTKG